RSGFARTTWAGRPLRTGCACAGRHGCAGSRSAERSRGSRNRAENDRTPISGSRWGFGATYRRGGLPATTTATAAAAAAAATAAGLTLPSDVDIQRTTVELGAVHTFDGIRSSVRILEGDETEAAAAASVTVTNHDGFRDVTILLESSAKTLVIRAPAEATHKKLVRHVSLPGRSVLTSRTPGPTNCFSRLRSS